MVDSAEVAGRLWDAWIPPNVIAQAQARTRLDPTALRTLIRWVAGVHDAGKAHPHFTEKVPVFAEAARAVGLKSPTPVPDPVPHAALSHVLVRNWLKGQGLDSYVAQSISVIPGGHHGVPPTRQLLDRAKSAMALQPDGWDEVQRELLDAIAGFTEVRSVLVQLKDEPLAPEDQMLLTGVVIAADWLASSEDLFPLGIDAADPRRAETGWERVSLTPPWRPTVESSVSEASFPDHFCLPSGSRPSALQCAAMDAARNMSGPGLMMIEAPMGGGKTEAALAAAEIIAARQGLSGAMLAMPTQATSDGILRRFTAWVARLQEASGRPEPFSLYLAHGKSSLNRDFIALRRAARLNEVYDDDAHPGAPVVAHSWLTGRKKGLLADFVVGTVDQVLFAALQSKHVVLRHLGLAGKVVIIDEVHAYDAFMGVYLDRALVWLKAYGVPVIMLSATLPNETRQRLLDAYAGEAVTVSGADDLIYPRITLSTGEVIAPDPGTDRVEVAMERLGDSLAELREALAPVAESGGCAGVICNTVDRAVEAYEALRGDFGEGEIILIHSRFIMPDRLALEERLRRQLGPDHAVEAAGERRPERLVVVGTQVLEQSLDIDFDLLVTDLAPADLVLQRMGRLHRRRAPRIARPAHLAAPRCLVRGVFSWDAAPPQPDPGSKAVYGLAALVRSAAVFAEAFDGDTVTIPGDIAKVVQDAYAEIPHVPEDWRAAAAGADALWREERQAKREGARTFLLRSPDKAADGTVVGFLDLNRGNADDGETRGYARVRDSGESVEVVVARRVSHDPTFLPWVGRGVDAVLPAESIPDDSMARELSRCTVRLPPALCYERRIDETIRALEDSGIAAWQKSKWLGGQLVLFLDEELRAEIVGGVLQYDRGTGLRFQSGN